MIVVKKVYILYYLNQQEIKKKDSDYDYGVGHWFGRCSLT